MTDDQRLRFGLAGTGYWARVAHARVLATSPGIEFAAIWGRNQVAAEALAADFGVTAYRDFDAFLAAVDAVAFAVPPDVQSELAVRAAAAGKHLLLEKPVAVTSSAADTLVDAVEGSQVTSVVFFTCHFQPDIRTWLGDIRRSGAWSGGSAAWLSSVYSESSPFNTPWRHAYGGLWDVGPHVVSVLWAVLGPVEYVTADAGRGDLSYLVLHHEGGATSSATLTLGAPAAAGSFTLRLWGESGVAAMPDLASDPAPALRAAVAGLTEGVRSGPARHPLDVRFGRDVTNVLVAAQRQLDVRRSQQGYAR